MAWVKTQTYVYEITTLAKIAFADWLFQTYMPTRGWTNSWKGIAGDDAYYSMKRTYTTQSGALLDCNFVFEIEPASNDFVVYAWDGITDYAGWAQTASQLVSDTTWNVIINSGNFDVWEDEDSDGFLLFKRGNSPGIFGLQLPNGGYLDMPGNSSDIAGTRPQYWIPPVGELGVNQCLINNGSTYYFSSTQISRPQPNLDVWQDYAAVALSNTSNYKMMIWEDLSQEWKMQSHAFEQGTQYPTVVKIDARYYLNIGTHLIPAGTTEPSV